MRIAFAWSVLLIALAVFIAMLVSVWRHQSRLSDYVWTSVPWIILAICIAPAAREVLAAEELLAPRGPVAAEERQVLFNALGIMLATLIPTILATPGVAAWFLSSRRRASYLPEWTFSGQLELLVWSIPAMAVILVGGIAWAGAHESDARRPERYMVQADVGMQGMEKANVAPGPSLAIAASRP